MVVNALIGLFSGVLAALAFTRWVGTRSQRAREIYTLGLVVTAMIYVVMAFLADASDTAIVLESAGVLFFGVFVLVSVTHHARWLGIGWLLHPLWDLALHAPFGWWSHAPEWYVWACVVFDIVVGLTILRTLRSASEASV